MSKILHLPHMLELEHSEQNGIVLLQNMQAFIVELISPWYVKGKSIQLVKHYKKSYFKYIEFAHN